MAIRILVADDHAMIRQLLVRHLGTQADFAVVGEAGDGHEAVTKAEELEPDIILMDVRMPGMDGIEATTLIHQRLPQVRILILSLYSSQETCVRAVQAGAVGYVLKESAGSEIETAIRTVMAGDVFFGAGMKNPTAGTGGGG